MSSNNPESQIQTWLDGLASLESKKHEAVALAIAKAPNFDARLIPGLKEIARNDPKAYAREAARLALENIEAAHSEASKSLRSFLMQLVTGAFAPQAVQTVEPVVIVPTQETPTELQPTFAAALMAEPVALEVDSVVELREVVDPPPPAPVIVAPSRAAPVQPPKPAVPFDQWLLSERNIKLALYSGGLLLLLAGLIFVGVNWAYLPGIAKLGVTVAVTLALYAGGALLFKRPALKIGGTALLAIASGFLPLNFVITHLYLTGANGGSAEPMWLVASVMCGAAYLGTALWTRQNLFTVLTIGALLSGVMAAMFLVNAEATITAACYALATLGILLVAYRVESRARVQYMARTLRNAAHILAPLTFLLAVTTWVISIVSPLVLHSWFGAFVAGLSIVAFYMVEDWRKQSLYARWCAAFAAAIIVVLFCTQLEFSSIQTGLVLKVLAAVYLVLGRFLQSGKNFKFGLPLYSVSALLAVFVTAQAIPAYPQTPGHLALALVGDVALLALAAFLFRRIEFAYAAAWLLMIPVYLYAHIYLADWTQIGLALSGLMLAYAMIGYFIGQARLAWGGAFLSAAVLLSVIAPAVMIPNFAVITLVLLGIALGYGVFAVWLSWKTLTYVALTALNMAVLVGVLSVLTVQYDILRALSAALGILGLALVIAAVELKRRGLLLWRLPFYLVATVDLLLALGLATASSDALVVVISLAIALVSFALEWVERRDLERLTVARGLTYLGAVAVLNAIYFATRALHIPVEFVPLAIAVGGAVLVGIGIALRSETLAKLYGEPLRYVGLVFSVGAWAGTFYFANPQVGVIVAAITAAASFAVQWSDRAKMREAKLPPVLSYLGAVAALTTVTFATRALNIPFEYVPLIIAVSGAAMVGVGIVLARGAFAKLYDQPLRYVGLVSGVFAMLGTFNVNNALLSASVFVIAAGTSFVLQWVERGGLERFKLPPVLSYLGAVEALTAVYFAARGLNVLPEFIPLVIALSGAALVGIGMALRQDELAKLYGQPLRYVGLVFGVGAWVATVNSGNAIVSASVAVVVAVASFMMQWVEREPLERLKVPPVLSYFGAIVTLSAVYFATRALNIPLEYIPLAAVVTCAVFVAIALLLRQGTFAKNYGDPLRYAGLLFSVAALLGAFYFSNLMLGAIVYMTAALSYGADGFVRKQILLVYAGGAAMVVALWWLLRYLNFTEWQAFVLPLGSLSLAIGWSESRRGRTLGFRVATVVGLVLLLGTAFYQSLSATPYALLLLVESVAAFALGVKMRSRIYVEAGILALFANGLAQFGPAFINLERWIQIGTIGSILVLGGLAALFRRQRLLEVRQTLAGEWKLWKP